MEKKYEMLKNDTIKVGKYRTLYRIVALRKIGDIKAGQLGGYIARSKNL